MPPERCLKCEFWNHSKVWCDQILKGDIYLEWDGGLVGALNFQTQGGLIPKHLEESLNEYLAHIVPIAIERWPGWGEVAELREQKGCPANQESVSIRKFGVELKLVKPLGEAHPEKNLDANGLFKSDISIW